VINDYPKQGKIARPPGAGLSFYGERSQKGFLFKQHKFYNLFQSGLYYIFVTGRLSYLYLLGQATWKRDY
jgi:hypothetical protein